MTPRPTIMASNSSSATSARVAIAVAIALQPVNTYEALKCQLREQSCVKEVLYDTSISLDRVFVFEFVKYLCIGAPSKDPAQRFVNLGFGIFEKQEKQEDKRVPKS